MDSTEAERAVMDFWTPGASGGPWFVDFKEKKNGQGGGFVSGVSSTRKLDGSGNNTSPYFNDKFTILKNQAEKTASDM